MAPGAPESDFGDMFLLCLGLRASDDYTGCKVWEKLSLRDLPAKRWNWHVVNTKDVDKP